MDLRRLEAFCKVYDLRSFSKAGRDLYLSQPTISAHIASLESELGVLLFDRLGRSVLPTLAAEALYRNARSILEMLQTAKSEVDALREHVSGEFAVGASTIPANYILPRFIGDFLRRHPEVDIRLRIGDSEQVVEDVASGRCFLGLVGMDPARQEIQSEPFLRDELVVVASPELIKRRPELAEADKISRWPWVLRERGSGTLAALEAGLTRLSIPLRSLNVRLVTDSTQAVLQYAKASIGVCASSRLAAQADLDAGSLEVIPVAPLRMERFFHLVQHKDRQLFPATEAFLNSLRARQTRRN
jgi:DNA-binding transcriptional LysR family regulator